MTLKTEKKRRVTTTYENLASCSSPVDKYIHEHCWNGSDGEDDILLMNLLTKIVKK